MQQKQLEKMSRFLDPFLVRLSFSLSSRSSSMMSGSSASSEPILLTKREKKEKGANKGLVNKRACRMGHEMREKEVV